MQARLCKENKMHASEAVQRKQNGIFAMRIRRKRKDIVVLEAETEAKKPGYCERLKSIFLMNEEDLSVGQWKVSILLHVTL